jgi:hypothetical protein
MNLPSPVYRARRTGWRAGTRCAGERTIPEETAVALT